MTEPSGRRRAVGLLVSAAALVVALAAAEAGLRLLWPVGNAVETAGAGLYAADPELGWTLRADVRMTRRWAGREIEIRTDAAGRRVPSVPAAPSVERPGREERAAIPFAGDSYVFGNEVQAEETFVHRVGERLGIPTVNLGVGGYGLGQAATALVRHLEGAGGSDGPRAPAAVLVLYVGNDLEYGAWPRSGIRVDADGFLVRRESAPGVEARGGWPYRAARSLVVRSRLAFLVARGWGEIRGRRAGGTLRDATRPASRAATPPGADSTAAVPGPEPTGRDASPIYSDAFYGGARWGSVRATLEALRDTTATLGVPLTVAVLPEEGQVRGELGPRPGAELGALLGELGIDALDLLPSLRAAVERGTAPWNDVFEGHLSPAGHRVVGERIAAHLRDLGVGSPAARGPPGGVTRRASGSRGGGRGGGARRNRAREAAAPPSPSRRPEARTRR